MDDLRAALAPFDAHTPLAGAPEPWDYLPMPEVRDGPPWAMAEMIAAEPGVVRRIVERIAADGSAAALAGALRDAAAAGQPVIITGCGTSEHAALGAAAILRDAWRRAGLAGWGPVAAQAFELAQEPPGTGLVIGVSHEGGTAATIAALEAARAAGARTALLTASAGAPAAAAAAIVLATVEMDRSWCHTVGYVSPMAAAVAVGAALAGTRPDGAALASRLQAGIEAAWGGRDDRSATTIGRAIAEASHVLVVASGVDRTSARELVLKIEEAAWVPSAMRDLETFLHGHLPATGETTALVLILTDPAAAEARNTRARQALAAAAATGIRTGAILSAGASAAIPAALTPAGRIVVPDAPASDSSAAACLFGAAGPLQLVTLEVAAARGTNPDPIRRDDPVYLRAAEVADDPAT
jgi:glucosamine--fructose-6-phosphate aminotransferase (isomerizing)